MNLLDKPSWIKTLNAALLVGGCCIGGGMLALPVTMALSGLIPSTVLMLLCWSMMTITGLFFIDLALSIDKESHIISITGHYLGRWGQAVAWILYLFIGYASVVAYTAEGAEIFGKLIEVLGGVIVSKPWAIITLVAFISFALFSGHHWLGTVNTLFFFLMLGCYLFVIALGLPEINMSYLQRSEWKYSLLSVPLLLTAFSFQTMVPSLTTYLGRSRYHLRAAVILGTCLAFIFYFLWQIVVLGTVPVFSSDGLFQAFQQGHSATKPLQAHIANPYLSLIVTFFGLFALMTSFIAMAMGLFDFLADGLKLKKSGLNKLLLIVLIAFPTIFCAMQYEKIFLIALDATGGIGDSILNGVFPVLMMLLMAKAKGLSKNQALKSQPIYYIVFIFFLSCFVLEILSQAGFINSIYSGIPTFD